MFAQLGFVPPQFSIICAVVSSSINLLPLFVSQIPSVSSAAALLWLSQTSAADALYVSDPTKT